MSRIFDQEHIIIQLSYIGGSTLRDSEGLGYSEANLTPDPADAANGDFA